MSDAAFPPSSGPPGADRVSAGRVGEAERLRRWRLVLGGADDGVGTALTGDDARIDAALAAVYDAAPPRRGGRAGGLGSSAPGVARWLGDIRRYFPSTVVQVLQHDAIERLNLRRLLLEPEMLAALEPDLALVTTLLELNRLLPETTRATARQIVGRVVADIESPPELLLSRILCVHPREAEEAVRAQIDRARAAGKSRTELLFVLLRLRVRCERYQYVAPVRIYTAGESWKDK